MHLFVDISSHGFGHLAITAPVLNALAKACPDFRLTVRSALPAAMLRQRIVVPHEIIPAASDFGYIMVDATRIDLAASAAAYRRAHGDWPTRVAAEARFLAGLDPDLVLTSVSYLPLAGAAVAGIPACSLCSLNWADLFAHFFGDKPWAGPIHAEMLAAYRSARSFLRVTPGMAMGDLGNVTPLGPIAALGTRQDLALKGDKAVMVAMGGIAHRLPVEDWPRLPGIRWLLPAAWNCRHPDAIAWESFGLGFTDLLSSVDAIVTKPGYGTFTEAACNGIPGIYQRREDWPEQDCLIDWLNCHGACLEIAPSALTVGLTSNDLDNVLNRVVSPRPEANGIDGAAQAILCHANA